MRNVLELQPRALTLNKVDILFVADEVEREILQLKIESNGVTITITATVLGKVECPKHSFGIAAIDNHVYCLVSNREGLGMSLQIMRLATIDSHMSERAYRDSQDS